MRITKRQLRRLIRESCGLSAEENLPEEELPEELPMPELPMPDIGMEPAPEMAPGPTEYSPGNSVPVPEDYQAVRNFLDQNPDMVDLALQGIMDSAGTACQRSTAQAIVDHMQELLAGSGDDEAEAELDQGFAGLIGL